MRSGISGTERTAEAAKVILELPVLQIFAFPVVRIWNLAAYANAADPRWPVKVMIFLVSSPSLILPCSLWVASWFAVYLALRAAGLN
jgi:hypothetical protein